MNTPGHELALPMHQFIFLWNQNIADKPEWFLFISCRGFCPSHYCKLIIMLKCPGSYGSDQQRGFCPMGLLSTLWGGFCPSCKQLEGDYVHPVKSSRGDYVFVLKFKFYLILFVSEIQSREYNRPLSPIRPFGRWRIQGSARDYALRPDQPRDPWSDCHGQVATLPTWCACCCRQTQQPEEKRASQEKGSPASWACIDPWHWWVAWWVRYHRRRRQPGLFDIWFLFRGGGQWEPFDCVCYWVWT